MRVFLASILLMAAACGAGRQHQQLGTGRITVAGGGAAEGPGAVAPAVATPDTTAPEALALPAPFASGAYKVSYRIWLPRAMEVTWTLRCGEHQESGIAGETFAQYQTRRVAQLTAERERERQRRAQVGSLVGGAVLGAVQAGTAVETPSSSAHATVTVDGAAAGAAAGAATVSDAPIALPPGDTGAGYREGQARFSLGDLGGTCAMEVAPLDPMESTAGLAGSFALERWFNAERAEQRRVAGGSIQVRADLRATLVARGADPEALVRRRAAEAAARAEADARARAEADRARLAAEAQAQVEMQARLDVEARIRGEVWATREAWYVYLGKCGGKRREELEAEERMRAQLAFDARARMRMSLIGMGADAELAARLRAQAIADANRRAAEADARASAEMAMHVAIVDGAASTRGRMVDALVMMGARLRPPMPAAIAEVSGSPPRTGARWSAGYWTWTGGQWAWIEGRWVGGDGILSVEVGAAGAAVGVGAGAVNTTVHGGWDPHGGGSGISFEEPEVDRDRDRDRGRDQVQDHRRDAPASAPEPRDRGRDRVQDHRGDDRRDDDRRRGGRDRVQDHR